MFRSDRDALAQEVEDLRHEREGLRAQNEAMRADILARRRTAPTAPPAGSIYKRSISRLTPGERTALARHEVEAYPTWAAVLLHFLTLGLFSLVHFSRLHGRLPAIDHDDPTPAKAIGFSFIPYFAFYWVVFNTARLVDRVNLQFRLRGLPDRVPRAFLIATAVISVIPYLHFLVAGPFLWPIAIFFLQRAANELAELDADGIDAAVPHAEAQRPRVAPPQVRVPPVKDLPGPDDVAGHQQQAEAEAQVDADADEALRPRHAAR